MALPRSIATQVGPLCELVLLCEVRLLLRTRVTELASLCPGHRWAVSVACYFITVPTTHALSVGVVNLRRTSGKLAFSRQERAQKSRSLPIPLSLSLYLGSCWQWLSRGVTIDLLCMS